MFKSVSHKLTTSLTKALCLPNRPSRALSSSPATMKTSPSSSSSTFPHQSAPIPEPNPAESYTPTDAATFSRLGASITALPPDEVQPQVPDPLQNQVRVQPPSPVTTLRCERLGGVVRSSGDLGGGREVYTDAHAAEFMRRGACMVVWPGVEGDEGGGEGEEVMDRFEVEKVKDGDRSRIGTRY